MSTYRIQLVESFYTGSHKFWMDKIQEHSDFHIDKNTLPGRHWKWRMSSGAINLAEQSENFPKPDLFILTDMVDAVSFRALIDKKLQSIPIVLYMHENQLYYPELEPKDFDRHFAMINFKSMLAAEEIWFNSSFHKDKFFEELPKFLKAFPDKRNSHRIAELLGKSKVVHLGIDAPERAKIQKGKATILWNHRWEHDKNPKLFFETLKELKRRGVNFDLIICGEKFVQYPEVFDKAKEWFKDEIIHWGYCDSRSDYIELLQKSSVIPVTSNQEYFGLSVMEALSYGIQGILPNQLVYPELYAQKGVKFYNEDKELLDLLESYCKGEMRIRFPDLREYYWESRIKEYDTLFERLILNHTA